MVLAEEQSTASASSRTALFRPSAYACAQSVVMKARRSVRACAPWARPMPGAFHIFAASATLVASRRCHGQRQRHHRRALRSSRA